MIPVSGRPIHKLTLDEATAERDYWRGRAAGFATQSKYIKIQGIDPSMYDRLAARCQARIDELSNGVTNESSPIKLGPATDQ